MSRAVSIRDIDPSSLGPNSPLLELMRRKPRRDLEHQSQVALFGWAAENEATYPELRWMFAVPNWIGTRTRKHGGRLKAEGRKPGVLDVWLPVKRGEFPGLVIELKAGNNRPTPEQRKWINHLKAEGWCVLVAWSSNAAIQWIIAYLAGKRMASGGVA
ncbi:MAG: VRR-NUC domain-containing protein [Gemmatimonadota bacterium]|nr:VRR-NUC domain-containing protein [Gemmatimonadota bacterium]